MKSIRTRLFLGLIGMAALTVAILWIVQAGFMRDVYINERISSVRDNLRAAALQSPDSFDQLADELNIGILIFDQNGRLSARSANLPMQGMVAGAARGMIPKKTDGSVDYIRTMGNTGRYALLGYPRAEGGYIFAIFSLADLDGSALLLRRQLWIITIVLALVSILLAIVLSRRISRPIQAVTQAARQLAAGQLDVRLPVTSRDETGQLTEALNDLSVELGRTEQLRRELIANVSHELRAPLTVIQGYAETVRDVTWPDEVKRTAQLDIIAGEAARLTRIVKDILDYSRLQAGVGKLELATFDICPLLNQLADEYKIETEQRAIQLQLDCQPLTITFDRDRFVQILHNLMNNAVNHTAAGGTIVIRALASAKGWRLEIRNQGEPISAADLPKIWERYYRSASSAGKPLGTGLGLAIVRSIAEQHKARYGVERDGEWTVFWLAN